MYVYEVDVLNSFILITTYKLLLVNFVSSVYVIIRNQIFLKADQIR